MRWAWALVTFKSGAMGIFTAEEWLALPDAIVRKVQLIAEGLH